MMKKSEGQTEPLLEALRPLDQINSLPPSLSPTQISSRLRLQTPQPAKRRGLTLRHVAAAAAALAIVIGAIALWKGLPYLEVVNRQTGDSGAFDRSVARLFQNRIILQRSLRPSS